MSGSVPFCRHIWQRYLFKETVKVFFLFLFGFFALYSLIDYSLHMEDFVLNQKLQFGHLIIYYFSQFIKRQELLIPLALLVATLKVLFSLNKKGELIALRASGIPKHAILRPLFLLALLSFTFSLLSNQFLLPYSLNSLTKFRKEHFHKSPHRVRKEAINVLSLHDRSKLIYREKEAATELYKDVFWIRSPNDLWHMQSLSSPFQSPTGHWVDHLVRNQDGVFEKVESFENYIFRFRFEIDATGKGEIPLEHKSISELISLCFFKKTLTAYEYPQALTYLLFKLGTPFIALIVLFAAAPFCLTHKRSHPQFATYAFALFGFITFFALLDAAVILAENLTLSPYTALLTPLGLLALTVTIHYKRSLKL